MTVDYGAPRDRDAETLTLFLTRAKPRPMPAIVDKRGLVTMYGRATTTSAEPRVPRLSTLVRLEQQHQSAVSRLHRKYLVAVMMVFAIGILAGALATRPALRTSLTHYAHYAARVAGR